MKAVAPIADTDTRFCLLFENTPELILYQNEASTILDANPAFLALVQRSREQVINHPYDEFLPPKVRGLFREKLAEAFTGKTVRFDAYAAQGDSAPQHWDVVKVPVWEQSRVVGVHMVARNITEKTRQQQDIFTQNQDLQQFTYIASHNLRAPLANALGLVTLLGLEEPGTPEFEYARTSLSTSLQRLDQVLQDMNTILSIRDEGSIAKAEGVLLAAVVQQVQHNLQNMLYACGGTLHTAIPEGFEVQGNRAHLYSIIFNLLSNAIKYRDALRPLRVELTATRTMQQGKMVQAIVVADNGLGINLAQFGADVFKLYKRFHPEHPGRGVGLYLTKTYVESMGGHIEVSSRPGMGAQFTITLQQAH